MELFRENSEHSLSRRAAVQLTNSAALRKVIDCLFRWHRSYGEELYAVAPHVIAETARLFLAPDSPYRQHALALGPRVGLSPQMVAEALSNTLGNITPQRLERLRRAQLRTDRNALIVRPRLVFHVLAGNLFLSGWESLILATLLGSCSLVRTSAIDRWFAALWVDAMKSVSPLWKEGAKCYWWPHEATDLTRIASEASDAVVAFGDDASIVTLRQFVPPQTQFVGHGHKISVIFLDTDDMKTQNLPLLVRKLAYDFSVYDQQGCLSPRALFVQATSRDAVMELGTKLVRAMRRMAQTLPPHDLSLEEAAALAREREETRIQQTARESKTARQPCDPHACVFSEPEDPFVVVCRSARPFIPSPVNRALVFRLFSKHDELTELLSAYRGHISTVAVARLKPLWIEIARDVGAGRICKIGEMQKPPLGWTHDGHQPLRSLCSLIEMQGVER